MEQIKLNCHRELSVGFELALRQLDYSIIEETYDNQGYVDYVVVKEEE